MHDNILIDINSKIVSQLRSLSPPTSIDDINNFMRELSTIHQSEYMDLFTAKFGERIVTRISPLIDQLIKGKDYVPVEPH